MPTNFAFVSTVRRLRPCIPMKRRRWDTTPSPTPPVDRRRQRVDCRHDLGRHAAAPARRHRSRRTRDTGRASWLHAGGVEQGAHAATEKFEVALDVVDVIIGPSMSARKVVTEPKNSFVCTGWRGSQRRMQCYLGTNALAAATEVLPRGFSARQTRLLSGANGTNTCTQSASSRAKRCAPAWNVSAARTLRVTAGRNECDRVARPCG